MEEINIEDVDISRMIELETELNETKLQLGELELQKTDQIEIFKSRLNAKLNFIGRMKKKYNFSNDDFLIDLEKKVIKIK